VGTGEGEERASVVPMILHSSFFIHPSSFILRAIAARPRSETTLLIKWIAARVQIGTAKGAKSVLPHLAQSQDQRKTARALEPCAQFVFQSAVDPFPLCRRLPRRNNSRERFLALRLAAGFRAG